MPVAQLPSAAVKSLYESSSSQEERALASKELQDFRLTPSAWLNCIEILNSRTNDPDVDFFAANTLANLTCRGIIASRMDDSFAELESFVLGAVELSSAVQGQISLALGGALIWRSYLGKAQRLFAFGRGMIKDTKRHTLILQTCSAVLELLMCDRKLALSRLKRRRLVVEQVCGDAEIEELLSLVHDASVINGDAEVVQKLCCDAITAWVKTVHWAGRDVLLCATAKAAFTPVFTHDLREWLTQAGVAQQAIECFHTVCHSVSTVCPPEMLRVLLDSMSHMSSGVLRQLSLVTQLNQQELVHYLVCLEDLSTDLVHQVLYETCSEAEMTKTLLFIALRCLHIPDTEIRIHAVKVFHSLLLHHLACLKLYENDDSMIGTILHREEILKQFLAPLIEILFTQVIAFPPVPDYETFDFKSWFEMRDLCATVIADCSTVCQYETILEMAGGELQRWVHFASQVSSALPG
eukprot:Gregarina_sp_Poly_1__3957@NODE_2190_length_2511_cov_88_498363_g1411_i0_p1_GENE_NODE_2190_length_2511_cov_88_498363_g1411_i0NODE_2190_length_2511_cov_88_498363_g1411_i0_p1_ORF_typecomplete_len466_score66_96Proteasom_PSMB/PF10508_9/0_00015IBN_N/PF03810_19/0_0085Slx4/PF09494_10/1_2Slx4/PF09494_10/3_1e03FANCI_S3/PF14677_6/5_7e03FANCI_S3/PF14677_6/0_16_NODE_2190_length_2511_cov_88_498363_g1411_i08192216